MLFCVISRHCTYGMVFQINGPENGDGSDDEFYDNARALGKSSGAVVGLHPGFEIGHMIALGISVAALMWLEVACY